MAETDCGNEISFLSMCYLANHIDKIVTHVYAYMHALSVSLHNPPFRFVSAHLFARWHNFLFSNRFTSLVRKRPICNKTDVVR